MVSGKDVKENMVAIDHFARLFNIVGKDHHEEAIRWIKRYSEVDKARFGVIKVSGASLRDYFDDFCDRVSILASLGLFTPIVYGWGESLNERLDEMGIKSEFHHQTKDRITTPEQIYLVRGIAYESGHDLEQALKDRGIRARICDRVFTAEPKEWDDVHEKHYTGKIIDVNADEVTRLIREQIVPIIPPLGICNHGKEKLNINGDTAANELVYALKPLKYIMVTNTGGILDPEGNLIQKVVMDMDYAHLSEGVVSGGMRKKLDEVKAILETLTTAGYNPSVQISHPQQVVRELFTDIGKGTYITKSE
ncbi:MAG: hypothetical protein KKE20_03025 [Nanoarchaeota archaeon]|nr:hypothetical protein [Nanoarchaeota archaeon]